MQQKEKHQKDLPQDKTPDNDQQQPVDKAPGEEVGKGEQVTNEDLKGKKVDRRLDEDEDQPSH